MDRTHSASRRDTALIVSVPVFGLLLAVVGRLAAGSGAPLVDLTQAATFDRLLAIVGSLLGMAIIAWWFLSIAAAFAAALLQRSGRRVGAGIVAKGSPAFMLRIVFAFLCINVLSASAARGDTPEPAWHFASTNAAAAADPAWKAAPGGVAPKWTPAAPLTEPGLLSRRAARTSTPVPAGEAPEVVVAGDTLWSIAARRSGPFANDVDVALNWPKWYAANKALIGDDPSLLRPGQVLQPPPG